MTKRWFADHPALGDAIRRLVVWAVVFLTPLPLIAAYGRQAVGPMPMREGVALGIIAYTWWLMAVLLSTRPRWVERHIGLPALYGLHGMLALAALGSAWWHKARTHGRNRLGVVLGNWSLYLSCALVALAVFFLSGLLVDRMTGLAKLRTWCERLLPHGLSVWVHRLNLLAVLLAWWHAHILVKLKGGYFGFLFFLDVVTALSLGFWVWNVWRRRRPRATLAVNEPVGPSLRRLLLQLDEPIRDVRPGDSFFLKVVGRQAGVPGDWHPFSLTNCDEAEFEFLIRQCGDFTNALSVLPVGSRFALQGPFGRFGGIAASGGSRPLILLGQGAGVAPLLSLLTYHRGERPINLLWSLRRGEEHLATELLGAEPARADPACALRRTVQSHRFSQEDLARALTREDVEQGQVFIIGPSRAVLAARRMLRRLGVARTRLHDERLTM